MSTRNKLAIKGITTIQGKSLYETTPTKDEYKQYTNTKKEGLFYFIHNGYLYITGSTTLKVVTFTAIFENPLDLAGINACDPDGNNLPNACFEPKTQDFPIDEDLFDDVEDMALDGENIYIVSSDKIIVLDKDLNLVDEKSFGDEKTSVYVQELFITSDKIVLIGQKNEIVNHRRNYAYYTNSRGFTNVIVFISALPSFLPSLSLGLKNSFLL